MTPRHLKYDAARRRIKWLKSRRKRNGGAKARRRLFSIPSATQYSVFRPRLSAP
jgi:hypothetical protein